MLWLNLIAAPGGMPPFATRIGLDPTERDLHAFGPCRAFPSAQPGVSESRFIPLA